MISSSWAVTGLNSTRSARVIVFLLQAPNISLPRLLPEFSRLITIYSAKEIAHVRMCLFLNVRQDTFILYINFCLSYAS